LHVLLGVHPRPILLSTRSYPQPTIARRPVVIAQAHKAANLPTPTSGSLVRRTHAGIRRTIGTAQLGKTRAGWSAY